MATPGINTKVKMDGEKEYRAALAQINAGLKNLGAEMRATEQDFTDNANSVEALTKKNDVLERTMLTQKEKVEKLQEVVAAATETYGEADKRTIDWKTSLINAETELKKMERTQAESNEELEKAGASSSKFQQAMDKVKDSVAKAKEEGTGAKGVFANLKESFAGSKGEAVGLGDAIGSAADKLGIKLPDGAEKALNALNKISAADAAVVAGFASVTAAIVKVEKKLIDTTKAAAESAKELQTLSSVTGQDVEQIQEFEYASEMLGVSYDRVKDSLKEITNKMQEARDGTKDAESAFDRLGVSIKTADGRLRDASDVLSDTRHALNAIGDRTERAAYEMDIFGGALKDLDSGEKLEKITSSMVKAQESADSAVTAFDQLGISITDADGNLRDATDVFYETVDALGAMQNRTERDALAMDLMSESAQELNPLIDKGSQALKDYADEAQEMGYVLDKEALEALTAVDDAYQKLQKSQEATKNQMATEFAPYLEEFYTGWTKLTKTLGTAVKDSGIVDAFGMLLETFTNIIAPTDTLADESVPKLTQALRPLASLMAAIADTADFFAGLLSLDFSKAGKALGFGYSYGNGNNLQTLREQWDQSDTNAATKANGTGRYYANGRWYADYSDYLYEQFAKSSYNGTFDAWRSAKGYNAAGTDNFIGGVTWVGENGPEPVWLPQGSRIGTNQEGRSLSGGDTYNFIVQANEIREIDSFIRRAKSQRRRKRMGVT